MVKNPPADAGEAGDGGSIPGWGRSPGERNGNPVQYSCLGNPTDRGAWQATVQRVAIESDMTETKTTAANGPYVTFYSPNPPESCSLIDNICSLGPSTSLQIYLQGKSRDGDGENRCVGTERGRGGWDELGE